MNCPGFPPRWLRGLPYITSTILLVFFTPFPPLSQNVNSVLQIYGVQSFSRGTGGEWINLEPQNFAMQSIMFVRKFGVFFYLPPTFFANVMYGSPLIESRRGQRFIGRYGFGSTKPMMMMMAIMAEEAIFSHGVVVSPQSVVAIVPRSFVDRHTQMIVSASRIGAGWKGARKGIRFRRIAI